MCVNWLSYHPLSAIFMVFRRPYTRQAKLVRRVLSPLPSSSSCRKSNVKQFISYPISAIIPTEIIAALFISHFLKPVEASSIIIAKTAQCNMLH